jgi:hypothetical protein
MSAIYKIIGEDGKEYGPVSGGQLRQWIVEGRVESRTPVFVDGAKGWNFVGLLPEFANCFAPTTPPVVLSPCQPRQTSSSATTGLICGILSWVFFCCCGGFPFNLLGLVFSLIGLSQISRHPGLYEGRGLAIAGLVLSIVSLLLTFGAVLWSLAFNPSAFQWNFKSF